GTLHLVMEYLPGGTLGARLARPGLMPPREAAELVRKLAEAVQAVHEAGIVHRDLKPGNVLFDAEGRPKVAEFGRARLPEQGGGLTLTGMMIGTPGYMPPEQVLGNAKEAGASADVWGLGALLYACLAGHQPFRGHNELEVWKVTCEKDPPPLRQHR